MQADETLNDQNPTNSCHPSRLGKRTARDVTRRVPAAMIINLFLVCLGPPDPMFFFLALAPQDTFVLDLLNISLEYHSIE